jgi:chemotaxis protein methyltransferase WspC
VKPQEEITRILHLAMGFDAAALSQSAVERAVRNRMAACGHHDEASYLVYLRVSQPELAHLIEEMVVPETWFFRDGKPFEVLQRYAIDEWLPANPERPLRLLSVPSSSGEEPYSAAMALLDAGLPPERISVEAVDISNVALAKARRGVYGKNSFRNAPPWLLERYFTATPHGWLLHEAVRKLVHFSQANLLGPDFALTRGAYDVIFCRNLLIYFDAQNRERALSTLDRLLLPQGILFVGHAESAPVLDKFFTSAISPNAFAYRKKNPLVEKPIVQGRSARRREAVHMPPVEKTPIRAWPVAQSEPVAEKRATLEQAQQLADQGRLEEAATQCEILLREQGASAQAYYLLGLVRDAGGNVESARDSFNKAVYLEPNHYEALVQLALLAERQGDTTNAASLRQRAGRVAQRQVTK